MLCVKRHILIFSILSQSGEAGQPWNGLTVLKWQKSLGYWQTPGELFFGEGRANKLSFVPARKECNIA